MNEISEFRLSEYRLDRFVEFNDKDYVDIFRYLLELSKCQADGASFEEFQEDVLKRLKLKEKIVSEIKSRGDKYLKCLNLFFHITRNTDFEMWLSMKEAFHQHNAFLRYGLASSKNPERAIKAQQDIVNNLPNMARILNSVEEKLFNHSTIIKDLYLSTTLEGYPEKYALEIDFEKYDEYEE